MIADCREMMRCSISLSDVLDSSSSSKTDNECNRLFSDDDEEEEERLGIIAEEEEERLGLIAEEEEERLGLIAQLKLVNKFGNLNSIRLYDATHIKSASQIITNIITILGYNSIIAILGYIIAL